MTHEDPDSYADQVASPAGPAGEWHLESGATQNTPGAHQVL
jgi:hypothetical protein